MFWIDPKRNIKKTYKDLVNDLNERSKIVKYIYFANPYEIILALIHSMLIGYKIELLDNDMSKTEIENFGLAYEEVFTEIGVDRVNIKDIHEVFTAIDRNKKNWSLTLYTSGTTGRPKKVVHQLETLGRSVLYGEKYEKNIWAFAYNPTHFAGLQVFLQSFFNRNTIVYIFDLDKSDIQQIFEEYKVTNISATPTFYRSIIPKLKNKNSTIKRMTLGGEKYDASIAKLLKEIFPEAKINNIYASTECGSLFSSNEESFKIKEEHRNKVKISTEGELLIHKVLMGNTGELPLEENWYRTGDIVEVVEESVFRFISRKTEMINIGGYKVNPHEVEEEIMKIPGVQDVLIKSRANRITGNILEAEIVAVKGANVDDLEIYIQKHLKNNLQNWKVPRIFKFVNEIQKTRTGKKVRK